MFNIISPVCIRWGFWFTNVIIKNRNTFNKEERLKSRKLIEHLFSKGKSYSAYPLKALYDSFDDGAFILKAGVTVGSRKFKKAVERNRVKRIVREAYRLQKLPLLKILEGQNRGLIIFFIYTGRELPVFAEVESKMQLILNHLIGTFKKAKS